MYFDTKITLPEVLQSPVQKLVMDLPRTTYSVGNISSYFFEEVVLLGVDSRIQVQVSNLFDSSLLHITHFL